MHGSPIDRLFELIEQPYEYGINDCCTAPVECVADHYGCDLMGRFRGRYSTKIGFQRALMREGCKTLADGLAMAMRDANLREVPTETYADMDFGLIEHEGFHLPAFYWREHWHGMTETGLVMTKEVKRSWRKQ